MIKIKTIFPVTLIIAAGVTLAAAESWSQVQAPLPRPETPQPGRAPVAPGPENLDPLGVRAGSFLIFPQFEAAEKYNDNIFARQNNKTGDSIAVLSPSLGIKSDWNNHALNFKAGGDFNRYGNKTAENFDNYNVGVDGRVDILRDTNLSGGLARSRLHEERGSPDDANGREPTAYDLTSGNASLFQRFNRVATRVTGTWTQFDYRSVPSSTGLINNDDRDRNEYALTGRAGYEFIPGYEAFVRATHNQREYDRVRDRNGLARDSKGYEAVGGATIDLGGITQFEVFAGYLTQDYEDARLKTVSGPALGGAINWNPVRPLQVRGYVQRTIGETTQVDYSASLNTQVGVDATYSMRPDLRLKASVSYLMSDYERNTNSTAVERSDKILIGELGAQYFFNRMLYAGPNITYKNRDSNITGQDYTQNVYMLRVGVRY
ncbi:MAG: outer membrane beta-barrel protein [Rhodospirillales bacterium]|nr:outer membrane beta-barrel protein [Rhodospirillales bacterium]